MSESSAADAPKNTIAPRRSLRSAPGSSAFHAGIDAARVGSREIDPDVSRGVGRDRQVAVADRQHAVDLPERRFAAGVRRLDDIGRGALRDAQSFHGETGLQGAVHIEDERHPSHDPVGVRPPVEEADASRMLRQLGQRRREGPAMASGTSAASSPAVTNPALAEPLAPLGSSETKLPRTTAPSSIDRAKTASGVLSGWGRGVAAVLFREQEIECDRRDPGAFQRVDKRGEALARPRPLPEPLERFVVDRDDADGLVEGVRSRLPALVLVEDQILHHRPRRRADDSGEQRQRASGRRGQCVKSGLVRPSHVACRCAATSRRHVKDRRIAASACQVD